MKYNLTLLSVFGLNLGLTLAQDTASLVAAGFPACAAQCIQAGNKASADKHGCGLSDAACQCTVGLQTANNAVTSCIIATSPCSDKDLPKIGTAGSALCVNYANKQAGPSSGGAAPPSSTNVDAAKPSASNSAGGAKPAAGPTSTKNAAASERTFAAGALGLAALAFAL